MIVFAIWQVSAVQNWESLILNSFIGYVLRLVKIQIRAKQYHCHNNFGKYHFFFINEMDLKREKSQIK